MGNDTLLIIPDIHGRDFWREGVEKRKPGEKIIFLGDYTDPYPHEKISHEVVPGMLEEIINIPDTILLLGNHDLSYIYPGSPAVRKDQNLERVRWLGKFFEENHSRFSLTYAVERENGTHVIFSHAGLLKSLYHHWDRSSKKFRPIEVASTFNTWWETREPRLKAELFRISWRRGGYNEDGSLVWADIREHLSVRHMMWSHDYQVFGHTMLKKGHIIQLSLFCCVDCQRPVRMWWNQKNPKFEVL